VRTVGEFSARFAAPTSDREAAGIPLLPEL
jgi:hypothetical protein